jgi:hypothetical protein
MAVRTHRLHRPHVSLSVAEHLDVRAALKVVTPVPQQPIHLLIKGAGVFPGGFLYLACVANDELLFEQRRAHEALRRLVVSPWPHFEAGRWTPHITAGWALTDAQLSLALPAVLERLAIEGWLDTGGVEDGTTGQLSTDVAQERGAGRDIAES